MRLPDEVFLQALPMLRRAFSHLSGHNIYYLTDTLLRLLQDEASPALDAPADASLSAEQVAAVWAPLAWLTDTSAP